MTFATKRTSLKAAITAPAKKILPNYLRFKPKMLNFASTEPRQNHA